jgi:hypothetical protein
LGVKLSIKAELAYSFADATQIIANIEASHTSDQSVLSETLDFQPPVKILSDKSPYGDRRIRASLSDEFLLSEIEAGEDAEALHLGVGRRSDAVEFANRQRLDETRPPLDFGVRMQPNEPKPFA